MKGLLVVLASVALLIATFALWVKRDLLDTDAWTETSSELIADEEVRAAVADFLVDRIDANVNREVARRLDKDLRTKARTALAAQNVRSAWAQANHEAHAGIVALVHNDSEEPAVLNLHPVLLQITKEIGIGPALAAKLPEKVGRLTILRPDQLEWAQNTARILSDLAYWLIALAFALYAAAVAISRGHRRETVGLCALGLLLDGAVILLLRWLGGAVFNAALNDTVHADGATGSIWGISTDALATYAYFLLGIGALGLLVSLALGRWLKSSDSAPPHYAWDGDEEDYEDDAADEGQYATER